MLVIKNNMIEIALAMLYHTGYSPKAARYTKYTCRILENKLFKLTFLFLQYW